ncbi:hypothetical protein VU08_00190 [Desulfobulbus sp. F5]|nr:hypothetical protein [Desulfobulbus sp. F5]
MDPVTMAVVNGIACGAAGGLVTATVPAAVKAATDAWNSFKALLQRKFGQDSALLKSVQELEQNPDSKARKDLVAEEVAKSKAHQDEELLAAAGKLLELLKAVQPQAAYHALQTGSGAVAQGTGAVAAGAGGIAVGGNVRGGINMPGSKGGEDERKP